MPKRFNDTNQHVSLMTLSIIVRSLPQIPFKRFDFLFT